MESELLPESPKSPVTATAVASSNNRKGSTARFLKGDAAEARTNWYDELIRTGSKVTAKNKRELLNKINKTDPWYSLNSLNGWVHYQRQHGKGVGKEANICSVRIAAIASASDALKPSFPVEVVKACVPDPSLASNDNPISNDVTFFGIPLGTDAETQKLADLLGMDAVALKRYQSSAHSPTDVKNRTEEGHVEPLEDLPSIKCARSTEITSQRTECTVPMPTVPSSEAAIGKVASATAFEFDIPKMADMKSNDQVEMFCPSALSNSRIPQTFEQFLEKFEEYEPILDYILKFMD